MLLDLIAIIFIIVISFIFCYKDNNYKCQLSHIIIGITVIVFYKVARYYQINNAATTTTKENFESIDTTQLINDFINGNQQTPILSPNQVSGLSNEQLTAYNQKLQDLIDALHYYNNSQTQSSSSSQIAANPNTIDKLDLDAQQQYQMFVIDYLNNQLQNARDIINAQTISNQSSNYKPIKVYSSCVISNANGTNTIQQIPVNSPASAINPSSPNQQLLTTISQSSTNSGPALMPPSVGSQSSSGGLSPSSGLSTRDLYPGAGIFSSLLSSLGNTPITVNV